MGTNSDLGQPFRPRAKRGGLGWEKSRLSHYDIRAEGALPFSIIMKARIPSVVFLSNISNFTINPLLHNKGARCSSMVRAFAHGAMGRWIDLS